jgi:hypothetical protein
VEPGRIGRESAIGRPSRPSIIEAEVWPLG